MQPTPLPPPSQIMMRPLTSSPLCELRNLWMAPYILISDVKKVKDNLELTIWSWRQLQQQEQRDQGDRADRGDQEGPQGPQGLPRSPRSRSPWFPRSRPRSQSPNRQIWSWRQQQQQQDLRDRDKGDRGDRGGPGRPKVPKVPMVSPVSPVPVSLKTAGIHTPNFGGWWQKARLYSDRCFTMGMFIPSV